MNILVILKQTFDTEEKISIQDGRIQEDGVEFIINPYDEFAVEEAIKLRDEFRGEVTAITVGPSRTENALRTALAMGADKAIIVDDESLFGDEYMISKVLAAVIKDRSYDVILAGNMSVDNGAGLELALSCDIRVADNTAVFGLPEVGLGILPGYGGTQRLTRLIGAGRTKLLILSGEKFSAEEALQFGIIEKLVPEGQALPTALALAKTIFNKAPIAVSKAKKAIDAASFLELEKGLKREAELFGELCETEDKKEGVRAFLEKDRPVFTGK